MITVKAAINAALAAAFVLATAVTPLPAEAANIGIGNMDRVMNIKNSTKNAIWVTVYGAVGRGNKLDYACVMPGKTQTFHGWSYKLLYNVFVMAEIKPSVSNCGDRTRYTIGPSYQATTDFECFADRVGELPSCMDRGTP